MPHYSKVAQGFIAILFLLNPSHAQNDTQTPTPDFLIECPSTAVSICTLLSAVLPTQIFLPTTSTYLTRESSYFSRTAQLSPSCIIQPRTAAEVSSIIAVLAATDDVQFAVRSGGHTVWGSGSNVAFGVTVDLGLLNEVVFDNATGLASVGPGARWGDVYAMLEPQGVMAAGARDKNVGVGGYLTGGGISYYMGKTGFACDSITSYEIVLANGTLTTASASTNSDLFKALKGGSGNFGIVTRFTLQTFPAANLWGGVRIANRTLSTDQTLNAMVNFGNNNQGNPQASVILSFSYNAAVAPQPVLQTLIVDVDGNVNSRAFDEFYKVPQLLEDVKTRNMSEIATTYASPSGNFNTWFSLTFRNDAGLMAKAASLHDTLVASLLLVLPATDFTTGCHLQPMPTYVAGISVSKGGNMLGLDSQHDPAVVWLLTVSFKTAIQEGIARPYILKYKTALEKYGAGMSVAWRYLNYADSMQNPLASYGAANVAFMKAASAKYDPTGLFQTKSPAGFKLSAMV